MQAQKASVSMFIMVLALEFGSLAAYRRQAPEDDAGGKAEDDADVAHGKRWGSRWAQALKPELTYSCEVGDVDRWLAVTPAISYSKHLKQLLSLKEWGSWLKNKVGHESQPSPFSYHPFVLRDRNAYTGRLLLKTVQNPSSGDPCIVTYEANCTSSKLQLVKHETCGLTQETELLRLGSFHKERVFCAEEGAKPSWKDWKGKPSTDVFVLDAEGQGQGVNIGNCVKLSTVNPTKGIELHDLDGDLMGQGLLKLEANESKMDFFRRTLKETITKEVRDFVSTVGETVDEARHDLVNVSREFNGSHDWHSFFHGSVVAGKTSAKWASKVILDSMVDSCLCCDQAEAFEVNENLADHCKVAYTLGGQNKSQALQFVAKSAAGTAYNFAKTAGGWVVPYLGSAVVQEGHKIVCRYACGLREPMFEAYEHGRVRKVPGLAVQTWWVPNPLAR